MLNTKYSFRDFSTPIILTASSSVRNNIISSRDLFKATELVHAMVEVQHNTVLENLSQEIIDALTQQDIDMLSDTTNDGVLRKIVSNTDTTITLESDLPSNLRAGVLTVTLNKKPIRIQYSDKIKIYWDMKQIPVEELNNSTIKGSIFYQESSYNDIDPIKDIFPIDMAGVIFQRCNLDNVLVRPGNIMEDADGIPTTNNKVRVQNDLEDWVLNTGNSAVVPVNKKMFERLGLSTDPKDIPPTKLEESVITTRLKELG
jgi:hypothetical protein